MKIIIAPDSFKENLTSLEVASAIEEGVRRVLPRSRCVKIPVADGGEGTVQSIVDAAGGRFRYKKVTGPAGGYVRARYGLIDNGKTAIIEMAEASGLHLVKGKTRNPMKTTTRGTGELIIDAIEQGAGKIIIGIGGSATNDAGMGMAQSLGIEFYDNRGREIRKNGCGGILDKVDTISIANTHPGIKETNIIIASDVENPLYGKKGAAYVFAGQKGATPVMQRELDKKLRQFARQIKIQLGKDIARVKGAGAAGGLGAGLLVFASAKIKRGIDIILDIVNLDEAIKSADLVITGEGRIDYQTAFGKAPAGVARLARKHRVPVIAIGGSLADDAGMVYQHGIDGLESAIARDMSLAHALENAHDYIANAAERSVRMINIGNKLGRRKK